MVSLRLAPELKYCVRFHTFLRIYYVGIVRGLLKAVNETTYVWYLIGKANNKHIPLLVYNNYSTYMYFMFPCGYNGKCVAKIVLLCDSIAVNPLPGVCC